MINNRLNVLEEQASLSGLLLRIKVSRPLNLWAIRLVVAKEIEPQKIRILGEMKAWAGVGNGLNLDTMRVNSKPYLGIGCLVWAATMAWALDSTPFEKARLLAIDDDDKQHIILTRYFLQQGFNKVRKVGTKPIDFPLRIVWGGSGLLMSADCENVFELNYQRWQSRINYDPLNQSFPA